MGNFTVQADEYYKRIIETVSDGILVTDKNDVIVFMNPGMEKIVDFTLNQGNDMHIFQAEFIESIGEIKTYYQHAKETLQPVYFQFSVKIHSGKVSVQQGVCSPLVDNEMYNGMICTFQDVTEKIKSDEQIIAEKERAEYYLNIAGTMLISLNKNGEITLLNKKGYEILGYQERDLIGKNWFDTCLPTDMVNDVKAIFNRLMNGEIESDTHVEGVVKRKDGQIRTISWYNTILKNLNGDVIGTFSSGEDITEKKQAEEELRKSELRLKKSQQIARIGSWEWDLKNNALWWSDELYAIFDVNKDEFVFSMENIIERIHPDDQKRNNRMLRRLLEEGEFEPFEFRIVQDDKTYIWVRMSIEVIKDNSGELSLCKGVIQDINKQKQMEDALRESEEKYRLIFEMSPIGITTADKKGRIIDINQAGAAITGHKREQIIGKTYNELHFIDKKVILKILKNFPKIMEGKPLGPFEMDVKDIEGKKHILDVHLSPLRGKERFRGTQVIMQDITERKKAEKELQQANIDLKDLNEILEHKVEERSIRIDRLLKQKDDFINQLGHDLKNPLGPLLNLLPLIEKKNTDPSLSEMFTVINRNVQHMKNLVTKTIQLAQLNSPNIKLNMENINIYEEIKGILGQNSFLFSDQHIDVDMLIPDDVHISVDRLRFHELMNNMLNNAVKYSKHDGGKISVNVECDEDCYVFSIKDKGIGMTDEQLEHVFDEFYKADSSRHDFDSSGLGMPICKRIVEMHGGQIWAESEGIGKGSTFYFTLPKRIH